MNCKPGDLAIVVRSVEGKNIGKVCEVLGLERRLGWWLVKFPHSIQWGCGRDGDVGACPDEWLRPLRDPGDDAKDEMLRPLPHKEIA